MSAMSKPRQRRRKPVEIRIGPVEVKAPPPAPLDGPGQELTMAEAIEILCKNKSPFGAPPGWVETFLYATTTMAVEMRDWNGNHTPSIDANTETYVVPAGTRVLVTMLSRFGDVGIRARSINPPSHGYHARVIPEELALWATRP